MDKSMEKIDITKLLLFLLVFMVIVFSLVLFLIVPNIKEYRSFKSQYSQALMQKIRVENVLAQREEEHSELVQKNRRALSSFVHVFQAQSLISYAQTFFSDVELKELTKNPHKKEFSEYALEVTSKLKTPTKFYDFLDGLNRYENIVQADFPINMEANESIIKASFTIKVYEINATQ